MHTQFALFSWNISFALFLYLLMLRFSGINYGDIFRNIFGNYLSYFNSLTFSVFKYILQPCGRRDISNCILRLSSILFDQFLKRLNNYINGILFFLHCILPFGNNHLSNKQFILFNCLKISTSLGKKNEGKESVPVWFYYHLQVSRRFLMVLVQRTQRTSVLKSYVLQTFLFDILYVVLNVTLGALSNRLQQLQRT